MEDVGASFHELDVLFLGISVLAVHYRVFKSAKEKKRDGTIIKNMRLHFVHRNTICDLIIKKIRIA